ncbi:MAG: selenocysteine-specific translation elongation factor [Planctomycetes bacterium]|nr:selenocysteine-specific translation elongation factor [Planctomycetota bacterium]
MTGTSAPVEIRNVVIGTAGHINHGKSSLVEALTGAHPDRLIEEKDRRMTTDLGFGNFLYQGKYRIGMIDVPGHEKFVKNMVAGATGVDIVLLVVAANDGVMLQTREHIEILGLLGVKRGVIAINKIDLVDSDTVELAKEDIRDAVRGTFLESAQIVGVSAITRAGFDDLMKALGDAIEKTAPKDTSGVFRMPVQRVFSATGQGAVLTGIPVSGRVKIGDNVVVLPGDQRGKVRGIQAYHMTLEEARAGHSTALNLAGIDHAKVHRGATVATPGIFAPTNFVSVHLQLLPSCEKPIKHREDVKFHVGTSEIVAYVHLLDRSALNPGESCECELLLEDPVVAGIGDRYILRRPSPAVTIGGGRVIRREADRLPRNDEDLLRALRAWTQAVDDPFKRVELAVIEAGPAGADKARLVQATELAPEALPSLIERLLAGGEVIEFGPSRALVHKDARSRARRKLVEVLASFHAEKPALLGLKSASVQQKLGLDGRSFAAIVEEAVAAKEVEPRGDLIGLPGQGGKLSDEEKKVVEKIAAQLEAAMLNPPTLKELAQAAGQKEDATQTAIDYLVGSGRARVLPSGVLFGAKALQFARDEVIKFLKTKGEAAAKDFKEVLPTSRKFLIPLLEWLDLEGVTRNLNGVRTLKQ